ncbi:hypothetical protein [Mycoplasmopsis agassizii]|uniref:Uncharacterized protein n=1 Tax=Mycoplasmopsis agassizii TaxID=33922 RepID=A0ABX4H4C5_9BACT|nr:hypothetical protein [Mycoplasmopsis agassizii]PAF54734.1 hypothetical protein CJF60_03270 [Mycoplasmopsis agassizii]SMC15901.1 hypothetical protein SAMN02745179_00148 [Mycoplasmopsis agassizii]
MIIKNHRERNTYLWTNTLIFDGANLTEFYNKIKEIPYDLGEYKINSRIYETHKNIFRRHLQSSKFKTLHDKYNLYLSTLFRITRAINLFALKNSNIEDDDFLLGFAKYVFLHAFKNEINQWQK